MSLCTGVGRAFQPVMNAVRPSTSQVDLPRFSGHSEKHEKYDKKGKLQAAKATVVSGGGLRRHHQCVRHSRRRRGASASIRPKSGLPLSERIGFMAT